MCVLHQMLQKIEWHDQPSQIKRTENQWLMNQRRHERNHRRGRRVQLSQGSLMEGWYEYVRFHFLGLSRIVYSKLQPGLSSDVISIPIEVLTNSAIRWYTVPHFWSNPDVRWSSDICTSLFLHSPHSGCYMLLRVVSHYMTIQCLVLLNPMKYPKMTTKMRNREAKHGKAANPYLLKWQNKNSSSYHQLYKYLQTSQIISLDQLIPFKKCFFLRQ